MAVHNQVEWRSGSTLKLTSLGERQLHCVSPGPTICPSPLSFAVSLSSLLLYIGLSIPPPKHPLEPPNCLEIRPRAVFGVVWYPWVALVLASC